MMNTGRIEVVCDKCKFGFSLDGSSLKSDVKKAKKGFIEVGFTCPSCKAWFRSYYTTIELEKRRGHLEKIAQKARTSNQNYNLYLKRKNQFQAAHDKVQIKAKRLLV